MFGIPSTTNRLIYLILRAQQIVCDIIKGIMEIFFFQEKISFGAGGIYEWDAFNPYYRYTELQTSSEVIKAKSPIFLMIKLNVREDGSEPLKATH